MKGAVEVISVLVVQKETWVANLALCIGSSI